MDDVKFEIRETSEKGRGLFATSSFSEGEVIFQEVPFVSSQFAWNEEYSYKACELCLRPLETASENVARLTMNEFTQLPYPELCLTNKENQKLCTNCGVGYCSAECQEMAWDKYHRTLCVGKDFGVGNSEHPLNQLRANWMQMHYPPETTSASLFAKIFATIHQSENKQSIKTLLNEFCHETTNRGENITHKLLGFKFAEQVEMLRQMIEASVPTEGAQEWITPEGFTRLLALVGTNGQGIGTSPFSSWVKRVSEREMAPEERKTVDELIERIYDNFEKEKGVGDFLNSEGSGLYKLQSVVNHSCRPNAEISFPNGNYQLAVTAIANMSPGDEICISYLDRCMLSRSRHSRQKALQENYLFTCRCEKCEEEVSQLDETSSEDDASFEEMTD